MNKHTRYVRCSYLTLLTAATVSMPAHADANKTLTLDTAGISDFRIDAGAGELVVEGNELGKQIEVYAEVVGDERDIRLSLKKEGHTAVLISEVDTWIVWWFGQTRIDLKVKVPNGLSLNIKDGSGALRLFGVVGNARIDDGSGSIEIEKHRGNLDIDDGSGSIDINGVVGDVRVDDGSGSMQITDVDGHVTIEDGSGSIDVEEVTKGLTILDDGSGGLSTRNISGGVDQR